MVNFATQRTQAVNSNVDTSVFHFVSCSLDEDGGIELSYKLPSGTELSERVSIPLAAPLSPEQREHLLPLVRLLHWVAGVSYFKAEVAGTLSFDETAPTPAQAALLEAMYSEGLGEFAFENELDELPRPQITQTLSVPAARAAKPTIGPELVAIGGGKDSVVALRIAERVGQPVTLFSVGDPLPIRGTAETAGLPWIRASRMLDQRLFELNKAGAPNGHVPITAIVSLIAALTAEANGFGRLVMANERSASVGNVQHFGIDVNHQWSKSLSAERLLRGAIADTGAAVDYFSAIRGASELMVARAFAQMTEFHSVITSCNSVFRIDESLRGSSWCGNCPKCRFVFLVLAPYLSPEALTDIFGHNLLDDASQYDEFARLASVGGFKPFECVGETDEALLAFQMLSQSTDWRDAAVIQRIAAEVPAVSEPFDLARSKEFVWSSDHEMPMEYEIAAREILRA